MYELVSKIGCICSNVRNEKFKNFEGFFPRISLGLTQPPKNILPSYGTVLVVFFLYIVCKLCYHFVFSLLYTGIHLS